MQLRISGLVLIFISVLSTLNSLTVQADFLSALTMQQDPPIELSGLLEFSSDHTLNHKDEESNNEKISLATLEVGAHVDVSEALAADIVWAYQEDLGAMTLDVMTANFDFSQGHNSTIEWQGVAGRGYLPFGSFETFQVNDTLGLELAETNQLFSALNYHGDITVGNVYLYENEEGVVGKVGARLGYHDESFQVELDYIDSLHDSPAYGLHSFWSYQSLTLLAEHILIDHVEHDKQSHTEQVEAAYDFSGIVVALSYQASQVIEELESELGLAQERISMTLHSQIHKIAHMGLEIYRQDGLANVLAQLTVML